jgi:hypothetical protein
MGAAMNAPPDLPPKPELPDPNDCCGSGCVRCIYDIYEDQLKAWEEAVAQLREGGAGFVGRKGREDSSAASD